MGAGARASAKPLDKIGLISYTTRMKHTHKNLPQKNTLSDIKQKLQDSLACGEESDSAEILNQQSEMLDYVFRRLLSDADKKYDALLQYGLALRAQNQYRKTRQAIDQISEKKSANELDKPA